MDRSERFYRIEALIKARGSVDFETLLAELEVSAATLKRDFQYLRDRLNAPIVWDPMLRGYTLRATSAQAGVRSTRHELPGVWFSERELHALLTMHQLIQGLDDGGVLSRHLQPLLDKLQGMLGSSVDEAETLRQRVRIVSAGRRPVPSRWFERLGEAVMRRRQVHMRYRSRGRDAVGERTVSPQRLVHYRNTWYLDAWCHQRDRLLRFALDAVDEAVVLDAPARELPLKQVAEDMDAGYGVFGGRRTQTATLVFSAEAARWVALEEWHPQQTGRFLKDGRYELKLPFANETELVMDILRHGAQVQVRGPLTLRHAVLQQLQDACVAHGLSASEVDDGELEPGARGQPA